MDSNTAPIEEDIRLGSSASAVPAADASGGRDILIPVLEEQLVVSKELVQRAVIRVIKEVAHNEELVRTSSSEEAVTVTRVPKNIYLESAPPPVRHEGDTMILSVMREVVVTETRLLLVEEVHITKTSVQTTAEQSVSLRKESISVVRTESDT